MVEFNYDTCNYEYDNVHIYEDPPKITILEAPSVIIEPPLDAPVAKKRRGRPRKLPTVFSTQVNRCPKIIQPRPRPRPSDLLHDIINTDYANTGLKTGSQKIALSDGTCVSSNCFRGLLGKGTEFRQYITFLNAKKRVPMTFSAFSICILNKIISDNLPHKPTIDDMYSEYKSYINNCKMWKYTY